MTDTMLAPRLRPWHERGTTRRPGAHLDRLPVGIDLRGFSLAEGVRAAVASGLLVLVSLWVQSFPLLLAAFAANLTCFCDAGGPLQGRVRALLAFTVLGALTWVGFGLLRNLSWPVVVPVAGLAVFLCSMARVWGAAAQAIGNVLIVTVALAIDVPLRADAAPLLLLSFLGGGFWAVLLTLAIWRVQPDRPAARALGEVWATLSALAHDLRVLALSQTDEAGWDAHARAHRRASRMMLEEARQHVSGAARARGPSSAWVRRAVLDLETAETMFSALIGLGDVLEGGSAPIRRSGARALRLLRPVFSLWSRGAPVRPDRIEAALRQVAECGRAAPALAPSLASVSDACRVMVRTALPDDRPALPQPGSPSAATLVMALVVQPLLENLTWRSAILRHAARATALTLPALAWSMIWWSPYGHWLTITVALTMQPYFAATWQRVLERVGGTLLGGLIGAAAAFLPDGGTVKAVLLVPLCIIGFSVRQVSYGAYIACLTPLVVVLFDVAEPGHSDAMIAGMRFSYTVLGGGIALAASLLLWPSWDSHRLRQDVGGTLTAYAALAASVLGDLGSPAGGSQAAARRAAGVASNNLEAALSRAMQEPRRVRNHEIEAGLVVDAALRRFGGALMALQHEARGGLTPGTNLLAWRRWIEVALVDLASGRAVNHPAPAASPGSALERIRRAIGVIDAAWTAAENAPGLADGGQAPAEPG
ncbi:FUSC family protein [Lichenihabitans sp. Uapishka_5]|uniref:FUSC family protein n=1 Tax=Lichenihabitans sp. Uapishka_5 TaxID=3037302 RepID=UPI0029E7ECCD|nr:FUSC family protein [Lichenihabitans sp. Uapishka_5]MDX7952285.1 FUSC family protein [Lichenihabitans sp. Uapishka_5]